MHITEWEKRKIPFKKKALDRMEERINHRLADGEPQYVFVLEEMFMDMIERLDRMEEQLNSFKELMDPSDDKAASGY